MKAEVTPNPGLSRSLILAEAKADSKAECKVERERKKEEAQLAAAGAPDELKQIVRERGWVSGKDAAGEGPQVL